MTSSLDQPSVPRALGRLERRLHDLERLLRQAVKANRPDTIIDFPGPIYELESDGYPVPVHRTYYEAAVTLKDPLITGPGEVLITVNDVTHATIALPPGTTSFVVPVKVTTPANSILKADLTDAGTGGTGLLIALRT